MPRHDRGSLTLPNQRRSFPKLVVAGSLGGAFGCGTGILFLLLESAADVFARALCVGLGIVAGLAAGATRRKPEQPAWGWVMKRGLIAAGPCVLLLAIASAFYGAVFRGFFRNHPGLESAVGHAIVSLLFLGLPVALVGLVIGSAVALCLRNM
jgi:hypothetical protein